MTDPIADLLTRIRNGYMAGKSQVTAPNSKLKERLLALLSQEQYIGKVIVQRNHLTIELLYQYRGTQKIPSLTGVVRVSKPGRRVYVDKDHLPRIRGGLGTSIISTSLGLMTVKKARRQNLGGEVICSVW